MEARKTALVTGASSGIGLELARIFAERGNDVVLVARSKARLDEVAAELRQKHSVNAWGLPFDLTDPAAPQAIKDSLARQSTAVSFLANNAGLGFRGRFSELDVKSELDTIQVDIAALTHLTRLFLPEMVEKKEGRILNTASTAAFVPGPMMAVYYASKAYVLSLSEALANEAKGTGVTVTALCPGPTRTEFERKAGSEKSRLFKSGGVMDARPVALAGYEGMMKGKAVVIPGARNRLQAVLATRLAPRGMAAGVARRLNEDAPA
jgi:uncharacterized protein